MVDPVSIKNLFSSFDTEAVISQLTAARQTAITKLDNQETAAAAKKAALAGIQTKFGSLLGKLKTLLAQNSINGKSSAVTGDGVSASVGPTAALGSFTVDVLKLASSTKAAGSPLTAAIDSASPLNLSNFGTVPSSGTYTIATATGGTHQFSLGETAALPATLLNASNFSVAPTSGTFTLATANGGSTTITVDTATQTLQDVADAITAAVGVGVTASITNDANGRANILTLTSSQGAITLGGPGDTSNFLTATNLTGATSGTTMASTSAFTKMMSLNDAITEINASGIGVTASITNDVNGKANILSLVSTQGAINLGNANDTSNFLAATGLIASPAGTSRAGTQPMARLNVGAKMNVATFDGGAPAAGDHTVTINGTSISYNAATDSLLDFVNRVNSSAAGVTLRYDSQTDSVKLQQAKTGSLAVTLADDGSGGNLLSRLGLLTATQALGDNAQYKIDGGPTQYSSTNSVNNNGATVTLNAITTVGSPPTVTVSQDSASAVNAVKAFVADYNAVLTAIDAATKSDGSKTNNKSGPLSGDSSLRQLKASLRSILTSPGVNLDGSFKTLSQIGLSFGAVGSAVGSTNTLVLDETKFRSVLASDPSSVQTALNGLKLSPSLTPGGTGSIASMTGTYLGTEAGVYEVTDDGAGHLSAIFSPADGEAGVVTTATVTAGGTNTTLIPGMTLTMNPVLTGGTHTIVVSPSSQSVLQRINDFVNLQGGGGGVLQKRQDTYASVTKDLEDRKVQMQAHIDAEMATLRKKFAAMEQAQQAAQGVQAQLTQLSAQLAANKN